MTNTLKANVTKGFEISSPRLQSPVASGRNTPELTDEIKINSRTKESNRNAEEMYNKERGGNKQNLHMV